MKLYAISDLHLDYQTNREALESLPAFPADWLILGGDLCTRPDHLRFALDQACAKFSKVFWVPGNHELWSLKNSEDGHGESKYLHLVAICREYGVHTPQDPYVDWPDPDRPAQIAPLFIPYDYSFRPANIPVEEAVQWAMDSGVLCRDEKLIDPTPYPSMIDWCQARVAYTQSRLDRSPSDLPLLLVNHFPLREDLVRTYRIPRFSIWCGTKKTEGFHRQYNVTAVVSGHLHMRATDYRDGVRFEEVSLGYPRDWNQDKGMAYYLREILPGPQHKVNGDEGPIWRFS